MNSLFGFVWIENYIRSVLTVLSLKEDWMSLSIRKNRSLFFLEKVSLSSSLTYSGNNSNFSIIDYFS